MAQPPGPFSARVRRVGEHALLLSPGQSGDYESKSQPRELHVPEITARVLDLVRVASAVWPTAAIQAGLATALVEFSGFAPRPEEAELALRAVTPQHHGLQAPGLPVEHVIPARYDGADLAEVARSLDLSPEALATRHTAARWTVAAVGFSPGFAYLLGDDPVFQQIARRPDPRPRVPAGSVALAGGMCAVYPSASPGGWQLIGSTDLTLFDPAADPPALLAVGDTVRFHQVDEPRRRVTSSSDGTHAARRGPSRSGPPHAEAGTSLARPGESADAHDVLRVLSLTGSALFQDSGRQHRDSGVPRSGAFDRSAHQAATQLLGGGSGDAAIEIVGRLALRNGSVGRAICITGMADPAIDGVRQPAWTCLWLPPESLLDVVAPTCGYLAIEGGFSAERVLGSRSTCLLGPLGPDAIRQGQRLVPLGTGAHRDLVGAYCAPPELRTVLRAVPGPHLAMPDVSASVVSTSRIGTRLRPGRRLPSAGMLPSIPVRPGAIQVLPSGDWILLGPDCGTMGGYPLAGMVIDADVDLVAHLLPGQEVRFQPTLRVVVPQRRQIVRPGPWP